MAHTFEGIMVYEILPNGCLNGVYTNDHPDTRNEIFNGIARKRSKQEEGILGDYTCGFMSHTSDNIWECDLKIHNTPKRKRNGQYHFEWFDKKTKKMIFEGTGWLTRPNQVTVSYRDIEKSS